MGRREYIGAGGMRFHLDDPLSALMAKQLASGQLHLAPAESAADSGPETDGDSGAPAPDSEPTGDAERPAKGAPVAEWRAYAVALGMDEEQAATATKQDCQDYAEVAEGAGE